MKICSRCMKEKAESAFSKRYEGLQPYCKECAREYVKTRLESFERRFREISFPNGIKAYILKEEL